MTDWNAVTAFTAHVVPWPASPQDVGYVNLHFSTIDRKNPTGPLRKGSGWPFRSVDTFISKSAWLNTTDQFKDQWFCLSLQKECKPPANGGKNHRAHRLAANALSLKAIWIDADVGAKPGEYPDIATAVKALMSFKQRHGLPMFSAMVGSGGGVHAYWISRTPLTVKEWAPYAEGLKALMLQDKLVKDAGITTDPARILRVPGSFNHKTTPPNPVQLFNMPLAMYDFTTDLAQLPFYAPAVSTVHTGEPKAEHPLWVDQPFTPDPAFASLTPDTSLQGGIDKHAEQLVPITAVFEQCEFYKHALQTGGADYDQSLWNLSILGATFMENGNAVAHAISKDHSSYSAHDTQALYDRKVAERADRGIGYPSCAAIAGNGCKSCATCPLFAKGKSPLNIRPLVTATVTPLHAATFQQSQGALALNLPDGYELDDAGIICEVQENQVQGETLPPTLHPLFFSKLTDPWVQMNPDCLNLTTSVDKGRTYPASIRMEDMTGMNLPTVLLKQKIKIFPRNKARLEHFMVSWIAKLHSLAAAQQSLPFGWYRENGLIRGFVYGSKLMKDDGTEMPCGVGDTHLRKVFHPTGDIQHWYEAAKTVTDQKRPELSAIVALSFSAPLTALVGQNAMTLCAYGDSGSGKTSAYSVGVGVWGNIKEGKQVSHSTFNSVMKTMGELRNLPLYWDEIKDQKAQQAVYDFIYNASDGVEKARLKSDTSMQDRGTWQTQMMMAANISFLDFVMKKDPSHVAGVSRVLEYNVTAATPGTPGRMSATDAQALLDKLTYSYGQMGMLYAKVLATHHAAIQAECVARCKKVETDLKSAPEERLWVALVGTLLVGARLANDLGAEFDLPGLEAFLYDVFLRNRHKRDTLMSISGVKDTTETIMTSYFDQALANDQMLWTQGMPSGPGKPVATTMLHGPKDTKNTQVTTGVAVRWDVSGQRVYILKDHLIDFLTERGVGASTCLASLERDYGMTYQRRIRLGAGTVFDCGRATACVFDVGPAHDWAEQMWKYSQGGVPPSTPAPAAAPIQTGFEDLQGGADVA